MKVLAVDDNPEILMLISVALEAMGHQVLVANDPPMGLDLLTIAEIDAVVLDVKMPHMTGYDMLEVLRRKPETRHLPVLLLSSLGDTIDERIRGIRLGANDFLRKPFDPEEVMVRLERMMAMRAVPDGGLAGDLAKSGLVEILQRLEQEERSGLVRVDGLERHGRIVVEGGALRAARYGILQGTSAVLEMLTLDRGFFSFDPSSESIAIEPSQERLALPSLVLKLAWLQDELEGKETWLPGDDGGLQELREFDQPAVGKNELPFFEVYERIQVLPGLTVGELVGQEFDATLKVRLAVAMLVQNGVIEAVSDA